MEASGFGSKTNAPIATRARRGAAGRTLDRRDRDFALARAFAPHQRGLALLVGHIDKNRAILTNNLSKIWDGRRRVFFLTRKDPSTF
jgi:hypothetical protein